MVDDWDKLCAEVRAEAAREDPHWDAQYGDAAWAAAMMQVGPAEDSEAKSVGEATTTVAP